MRLGRGLFVLAIVAALWGAPLSVSAAVNELNSPQVSPGSGSVATVFTFRVRYEGGFPAAAVSVGVAGLTLPLVLESGSTTAGWWAGSSLLPSGAWSTSFRATAARGPSPTANGPVVIVAGLAVPSPTSNDLAPPDSGATPESAPADGLAGATAPAAPPAQSPDAAAALPTTLGTAAPAAPGPDPGPGGSAGAEPASGGGFTSTAAQGGGGDDASAGQGAPVASPPGIPPPSGDPALVQPLFVQPASDTEPRPDSAAAEEMVSDVLLLGVAGVASVAVVGILLLIAARRREPERVTVTGAPGVADDASERRVVRSGRSQPSDDPILAALGVDDEMAARRAIRRARPTGTARPEKAPKGS